MTSSAYYDVSLNTQNFSISESTTKPKKRHYAVASLKKIEKVLREGLQYSSAFPDGHRLAQMTHTDSVLFLKNKALEICNGYVDKQSKLCWLWRKIFSKRKQVEALYNHIKQLTPPTTDALPLNNDCLVYLFDFLDTTSLGNLYAVNRDAKGRASYQILTLAKKYGYQGNDIREAKKYLQSLHHELRSLVKKKWKGEPPQQALALLKKSIVHDSQGEIQVKNSLSKLQNLPIDDLAHILSIRKFHLSCPHLKRALLASTPDDQFTNLELANVIFFKAIKFNDVDTIRFLHKHGVDINQCDNEKNAPLHYALSRAWYDRGKPLVLSGTWQGKDADRRFQTVKTLIESGATIHDDMREQEALEMAVAHCSSEVVELFLANMNQLPTSSWDLAHLLELAIKSRQSEKVLAILNMGGNSEWGVRINLRLTNPKLMNSPKLLDVGIEYGVHPVSGVHAIVKQNVPELLERLTLQYGIKLRGISIPKDSIQEVLELLFKHGLEHTHYSGP